jgi:hypothetical protein
MHLTLRAPGMEPLMMDAREDMSIADVVSVFHEKSNVSDEEVLAVFNGSGDELIQSATFMSWSSFALGRTLRLSLRLAFRRLL